MALRLRLLRLLLRVVHGAKARLLLLLMLLLRRVMRMVHRSAIVHGHGRGVSVRRTGERRVIPAGVRVVMRRVTSAATAHHGHARGRRVRRLHVLLRLRVSVTRVMRNRSVVVVSVVLSMTDALKWVGRVVVAVAALSVAVSVTMSVTLAVDHALIRIAVAAAAAVAGIPAAAATTAATAAGRRADVALLVRVRPLKVDDDLLAANVGAVHRLARLHRVLLALEIDKGAAVLGEHAHALNDAKALQILEEVGLGDRLGHVADPQVPRRHR